MSAPTFIAKATASSSNASPHSQAYMGSINANDLLILAVFTNQVGGTIGDISTPAGWTFVQGGIGYRNNSPADVGTFKVFSKLADGTETGSVSITISGSTGGGVIFFSQMYQFRGDSRTLVESAAVNILGDGNSTITFNAISVSGNERTLIAICGQNSGAPGVPTGYTNEAQDDTGGLAFLHLDAKENVSSDGSVTATGGHSDGWATVHFSIFSPKGRNQIIN